MHETVVHAQVQSLAVNEFGNLLVEVGLEEPLAESDLIRLESVGGLECTVLKAEGTRLVLVVPEFLVPMTAEWASGQRIMLTGRP